MKMDLEQLCKLLAQAKEKDADPMEDCNTYLLERVLRPLMRSETVLLKDVDFGQFDIEDIGQLVEYYESLEVQGGKLSQLAGALANIAPTACKSRRFC